MPKHPVCLSRNSRNLKKNIKLAETICTESEQLTALLDLLFSVIPGKISLSQAILMLDK